MKDAQGHGSNPRGDTEDQLFKTKPNWLAGALAAMRAHYVGGIIDDQPHAKGVQQIGRGK